MVKPRLSSPTELKPFAVTLLVIVIVVAIAVAVAVATSSIRQTEFSIKNSIISCRGRSRDRKRDRSRDRKRETHRIELVLALHVMLYEHDVMYGLFQLKRILFACRHIAHGVIQAGKHRRQPIVAAQRAQSAAQCAHQATESATES